MAWARVYQELELVTDRIEDAAGAQFACFTSTKVQNTDAARCACRGSDSSEADEAGMAWARVYQELEFVTDKIEDAAGA